MWIHVLLHSLVPVCAPVAEPAAGIWSSSNMSISEVQRWCRLASGSQSASWAHLTGTKRLRSNREILLHVDLRLRVFLCFWQCGLCRVCSGNWKLKQKHDLTMAYDLTEANLFVTCHHVETSAHFPQKSACRKFSCQSAAGSDAGHCL